MNEKFILDAACGGKMMWINKNHPNTVYIDIRKEEKGHIKWQKNHVVQPDIVMDFRKMDFEDKSFKLVVFDPPQLFNLNRNSVMYKKYGSLDKNTWKKDIYKGFSECWRVLEDYGILIFKWNDRNIKYSEVLKVIQKKPLFQNKLRKKDTLGATYWACFMKIPEGFE